MIMKNGFVLSCIFLIASCGKSGSGAATTTKGSQQEDPVKQQGLKDDEQRGGTQGEPEVDIDTEVPLPIEGSFGRNPETTTVVCDLPELGQCDEYDGLLEDEIPGIQQACEDNPLGVFERDVACADINVEPELVSICERENPEPTSYYYDDSPQGCEKPQNYCENNGGTWIVVTECTDE